MRKFLICILIMLLIFVKIPIITPFQGLQKDDKKNPPKNFAGYLIIAKNCFGKKLLQIGDLAIYFSRNISKIDDNAIICPNRVFKLNILKSHHQKLRITSLDTCKIVNVTPLWNKSYYGEGIIVAVIDSGISPHVELRGKILRSKSFVSKKYGFPQDEPYTTDPIRHGTAVAGIIAGTGKRPEGQGIAPHVKLLNARVVNSSGFATEAAIIAAIKWSVENGADIINLSLGAPDEKRKTPLQLAIEWAVKQGVVVIASAGNEGLANVSTSSICDPGVQPMVITVGSTWYDKWVSFYSSTGPTHDFRVKPDLVAPGELMAPVAIDDYNFVMGTSFAAPHVSGICALLLEILQREFNITKNIRRILGVKISAILLGILRKSAKDLGEPYLRQGAGLVNAGNAYYLLKNLPKLKNGNITIPAILDVFPSYLPDKLGFPWKEKVFIGSYLALNFSIATTFDKIDVYLENLSDVFVAHFDCELHTNGISIFEFNVSVKDSTESWKYGKLVFSAGNITIEVRIRFYLCKPKTRVLLDSTHTGWTMDTIYGQFFYLRLFAENLNVSLEQLFFSPSLNFLRNFSVVIVSDPATFLYNGTIYIENEYISLLQNYVNLGGILIVMAMFPSQTAEVVSEIIPTNNITELNKLARKFGVQFLEISEYLTLLNTSVTLNERSWLTLGLKRLPFVGTGLEALWENVSSLAWSEDDVDLILLSRVGNGCAIFVATNFIADNLAFNGFYGNPRRDIRTFWARLFLLPTVQFSIVYEKINRDSCEFRIKIDSHLFNVTICHADLLGVQKIDYKMQDNIIEISFIPRCGGKQKLIFTAGLYSFEYRFWVNGTESNPPRIVYPPNNSVFLENYVRIKVEDNYKLSPYLRIRVRYNKKIVHRIYNIVFIDDRTAVILLTIRGHPNIEIDGIIFDLNGNKLRFQLKLYQIYYKDTLFNAVSMIFTCMLFASIVCYLRYAREENIILVMDYSNKKFLVNQGRRISNSNNSNCPSLSFS